MKFKHQHFYELETKFMKTLIANRKRASRSQCGEKGFAIDTTFVLFFLAVEFGQTFQFLQFDTAFFALDAVDGRRSAVFSSVR